jgi:PncC family amidohydrolase
MEDKVSLKYKLITERLIGKGLSVTTMESCTAGLIASLLTDTEGASAVMKGAFVTYSNEAKVMQGVPEETIERYGVYSAETALAMAAAAKKAYKADISVGVTGTTGNSDPANPGSTPGEVFFAIDTPKGAFSYHISVPTMELRSDYKLFVADAIANEIISVI